MDKTIHEQWTCKFAKVKAVVVQLDELISRIKIDHKIQKTTEEPLSINIFTTRADAGEPKVEAPKSANYQSCVFGQDTQISWKFSGIEKSQVTWFFKGQPLPTNSRFQVTETDDGTSTLSIHQAELVDQGDYIARATNADGEAEARTTLNIVCIKPIINTNLDAAMQVTKDETMTLKIAASGTPKPGIVWMRVNQGFAAPHGYLELPCQGRHCATCGKCRDWYFTGDPQTWQWMQNVDNWNSKDKDRWCNADYYHLFKLRDGATCDRYLYFRGGGVLFSVLSYVGYAHGTHFIRHICVCQRIN
ncbi:unnamed protein product [Rotaria sp. Silwood1]|nr:unnamed protein product [Rotaria sp. Silwood1]